MEVETIYHLGNMSSHFLPVTLGKETFRNYEAMLNIVYGRLLNDYRIGWNARNALPELCI